MNDQNKTAQKAVQTSDGIGDAVWEYMISVKKIRKADGKEVDFDREKLHGTLRNAFIASGMKDEKDIRRITEQVMSRLQTIYNGHTVPKTADIREIITMTLVDANKAHVAKKFMTYKQSAKRNKTEGEIYGNGVNITRYFTKEGVHPYDEITWEKRTASIKNEKGEAIFEQHDIETPSTWSQTATNIVAQKYFRGKIGTDERETSMKQLMDRVAKTVATWGRKDGYFASENDAQIFEDELTHIIINQKAAFNSPVWFNVGVSDHPQCSACFINSVDDDMRSIMHLAVTESMLFKGGSGTGSNLSKLRSSHEFLGGSNGKSSGPISFMKGFDAFAGIVKSGGKTRRAAKMVILDIDHPDIIEFIECKVKEEKKAWALIEAGYDGSITGEAYNSIFFQNANNSVRVTDNFMQAVEQDKDWNTVARTTGENIDTHKAKTLFRMMAQSAWECGDPGIQYDTTINTWHTSKNSGRINASNPCSEYMFLDDSACNLASLNLMKYRKEVNGVMEFDVESFKAAATIIITAMEILVGNSSYPTPAIEQNSHDYRPLGIGFANLGALLMSRGVAYDSDEGRNMAGSIMALLSGQTYYQSSRIAEKVGPFAGYKRNEEPMLEVIGMHRDASYEIPAEGVPADLLYEARKSWDMALDSGKKFGYRNSQISVLAPTGTIAFLMDCDTTGVEPDIALVKYKWLVSGGLMKIVNGTVPEALTRLGYSKEQSEAIIEHIDTQDTIEGAPHIKEEHLPVFDCAFKAKNGVRSIQYMGHLRMMAAVQPFISGAISKTVNLPHEATVEDIEDVYMAGWKMGLKAIAVYRDGSKRVQALTTSTEKDSKKAHNSEEEVESDIQEAQQEITTAKVTAQTTAPRRRRLPDERRSLTHRFNVGSHKGYITVGLYNDGAPGEIFITMSKEGSVISGLMDAFATSVSMALQYGVPLPVLVNKFSHMRFEPSGFTNNEHIRMAKSLVDYIFRWLGMKFLSAKDQNKIGLNLDTDVQEVAQETVAIVETQKPLFEDAVEGAQEIKQKVAEGTNVLTMTFDNTSDAPVCDTCGSIMVRNAACYKCLNCGNTSGCS